MIQARPTCRSWSALALVSLACTLPAAPASSQPAGPAPRAEGDLTPVRTCVLAPGPVHERCLRLAPTCHALLDALEQRGHVLRFERAAAIVRREAEPGSDVGDELGPASDADLYRSLEASARIAALAGDDALEERVRALVDKVVAAACEDGYLHTHTQLLSSERPFRDRRAQRELYCAGELVRAGFAVRDELGDERLLAAGRAFCDLIEARFGEDRIGDPPGHPGIERALMQLAESTGDEKYSDLAVWLIEQRGQKYGRTRTWGPRQLDSQPVLEQRTAEGDTLMGVNLFCAVTAVATATRWEDYWRASLTFFDDMLRAKSYVTGGVGVAGGSFGPPHERPQELAECRPEAAAGLAEWSHALTILTGHATYADFHERVLFNELFAAFGPEGGTCATTNPPLSGEGLARAELGDALRSASSVAAYLPTVAGRVFATRGSDLHILQYISCRARVQLPQGEVTLVMQTDYPNDGQVNIRIECARPTPFRLFVRVPGWCTDWITLGPGDSLTSQRVAHGHDRGTWLNYKRTWEDGDTFTVKLPMFVERLAPPRKVEGLEGRVALQRGPVVYAFEGLDHADGVDSIILPRMSVLPARPDPDLGGAWVVNARGFARREVDGRDGVVPVDLRAVPFWACGARGASPRVTWLAAREGFARLAGEAEPERQQHTTLRASHVGAGSTLLALNDQRAPEEVDPKGRKQPPGSPDEAQVPMLTFVGREGTREWVRYDFDSQDEFVGAGLFWVEGEHKAAQKGAEATQLALPGDWRLYWLNRDRWEPVKLGPGSYYETRGGRFNHIEFEAVRTRSFKLEVTQSDRGPAGIYEWRMRRKPK